MPAGSSLASSTTSSRPVRRRRALLAVGALVVLAACSVNGGGAPSGAPAAPTPQAEAFLDTVQVRTFQWFWDLANTRNGLIPDRAPTPSFSSIAAVGFALTGYPIGVERGWITRAEARERTLTTLRFFWTAPQSDAGSGVAGYKGFFYHFLDMQSGARFERVELSTIDTALLLAGALTCQVYFDGSDADEVAIRAYADSIYRRVDWQWAQPHPPKVSHG